MEGKCQSLVRSRIVEVASKYEPGKTIRERQSLREPEPCGDPGTFFEVRCKAKRNDRVKHPDIPVFAGRFELTEGAACVKQAFCEKHRKKAEREGKKLTSIY